MWTRRDVLKVSQLWFVLHTSCSTSCVLHVFFSFAFVVISFIFALPAGAFVGVMLLVDACGAVLNTLLVLFAVGEALGFVVGASLVFVLPFSLSHFLLFRLFRCVDRCVYERSPAFWCRIGWRRAMGLVPGEF